MSARRVWLVILVAAPLVTALSAACSDPRLAAAPNQAEDLRAEIERVLAEDRAAYGQAQTEIAAGTTKVDAYRGLSRSNTAGAYQPGPVLPRGQSGFEMGLRESLERGPCETSLVDHDA